MPPDEALSMAAWVRVCVVPFLAAAREIAGLDTDREV